MLCDTSVTVAYGSKGDVSVTAAHPPFPSGVDSVPLERSTLSALFGESNVDVYNPYYV